MSLLTLTFQSVSRGHGTFHHIFNYVKFCNLSLLHSDHSKGFGGKYGVDKGKVDKAAMGYDYKGETEKHQSQKGDPSMAPHNHFIIIIIKPQWHLIICALNNLFRVSQ